MRSGFKKWRLVGMVFIALALNTCSRFMPYLLPLEDLPEPPGPHAVGTGSLVWTDSSRNLIMKEDTTARELLVQVWYPAQADENGEILGYIDHGISRLRAIGRLMHVPPIFYRHFLNVKTNAYQDAPILECAERRHVILFSHGLGGMRFQNSILMETLASHGFICLAIEHPGDANLSVTSSGISTRYEDELPREPVSDAFLDRRRQDLENRVADMAFILNALEQQHSTPSIPGLRQQMDLGHIGVMGHSLGAASVLELARTDPRVQAVLSLDGWFLPFKEQAPPLHCSKPLLHLGQDHWRDPRLDKMTTLLFSRGTGPRYRVVLYGTRHTDFTDMPHFTPLTRFLGYTGQIQPELLGAFLNDVSVAFFRQYLAVDPAVSLTATLDTFVDFSISYMVWPARLSP